MRVAVNVEQLLYRPPGGIGRYTAKLVTLLPRLFPDDSIVAFTAWHRRADIAAAWPPAEAGPPAQPGAEPPAQPGAEPPGEPAVGPPGQPGVGSPGQPDAGPPGQPDAGPPAVVEALAGRSTRAQPTGPGAGGGPEPVRLPFPRPVLYEAWNTLGMPRLDWLSPRLRGVDLVHAPSVAVPPRGRVPLVVTIHDVAASLFPEAFPRHGRWFHARGLAAAAERADLVITVSEAARAEILAHSTVLADRVRVVANGVDHVEPPAEEVAATLARHGLTGRPYVLWVGTVEPRKNVGALVEAFARLEDASGHRLVLAGPSGWLSDDLVPPAVRGRLGDRLRLLGSVGESELRALYAGATVFALPSRHEGFGLPVLEAMAQGAPVVCSDIPALRELAGGAARLVPATDVDAWAQVLQDLLGDDAARASLAAAGRARAADFSWERTVRETREVYVEALQQGR